MTTATSYIYAGAAHWTSAGDTTNPGGLFRRAVDGEQWEALTNGLPSNAEVRAIAIHPDNPQLIYAGTQDGPYRSKDGGDHWEKLPFPDLGMTVWSMLFHPKNPQIIYLGTAPAAVYRSDDGGDSWRRLPNARQPERVPMAFDTRLIRMTIDPNNPDEIYAGVEVGGLMRSLDGGETWTDCSAHLIELSGLPHLKSRIGTDLDMEGMLDTHSLTMSAAQPGTVYLAVRMGLFRSNDHGMTWEDMEVGRFSPLTYARDVQVSPQDPNIMYACLSPAARSRDGSLWRSEDLGQTWARFDHGIKANSTMMSVGLHPRDPQQVYCVSRSGQVFGTQDGGASWKEYRLPENIQDVYVVACS
ncbi:MAG: WD40/YVTN/BNR-like repeat-containing protein [Candidatus Tectimicrobiota bacterium]